MSFSKAQPDHAGLQADRSSEAPEVVQPSRPWGLLGRNSSQNGPELHGAQSPPLYSVAAEKTDSEARRDPRTGYGGHAGQPGQDLIPEDSRRFCGLRRRTCIILAAAIAILILIAIVLGAVLGTVFNAGSPEDRDSSSSTSSHEDNSTTPHIPIGPYSGFASMFPVNSSTLHLYYQDEQGRIVENQLAGEEWAASDDPPPEAIVAEDARRGSPLAAISWDSNGTVQRQVFYFDGNDRLMAANTSGDDAWRPSFEIPETDPAMSGSPALSACVDTKANYTGLDGIRVYYASATNERIQEVGMDFFESESNIWHAWASFDGSDSNSGVSCAYSSDSNVTNVYMFNATDSIISMWTWNYYTQYALSMGEWEKTSSGAGVTGHTDIAAATDGEDTDYIFFQNEQGRIIRTFRTGPTFGSYLYFQSGTNATKLAAAYGDIGSGDGSLVFFQAYDAPDQADYAQLNRNDDQLASGTLS